MSLQLKVVIFLVVSAGSIWVSRTSLNNFRSHGFYRFFAFETITAIILLNIDYWFYKPFSPPQIISWVLLIISLYLVIHGFILLKQVGEPDRKREDQSLIGIEKTTKLVTSGIYSYIRHPLYSSLFVGTWGVFFKHPSWLGILLVTIILFFTIMTAKKEESENLRYFGDAYQNYMEQTKMFIPFLF